MTDDEFIDGALRELPDQIKAAAAACLAAQSARGGRLSPREVKDTCRALGLSHYDEQTPVLALLGWVYSPDRGTSSHSLQVSLTIAPRTSCHLHNSTK